jgi:hypothetical protein
VNVINLLDNIDNPLGARRNTFVVNLYNALSACGMPLHGLPTTPTTLGNTRIQRKQSNIFSLVMNAIVKNSKEIVQIMDCINFMQVDIEKCYIDIHEHTMKDQLKYFK